MQRPQRNSFLDCFSLRSLRLCDLCVGFVRRFMRRFLIDTDTASDDAVALVMALRAPDVRVEAITVVSGNLPVAQATENALYTVELCGRAADVPVFRGADRPLLREPAHAEWFHGRDGFGNQNYP